LASGKHANAQGGHWGNALQAASAEEDAEIVQQLSKWESCLESVKQPRPMYVNSVTGETNSWKP
jgi:hypothetical protein